MSEFNRWKFWVNICMLIFLSGLYPLKRLWAYPETFLSNTIVTNALADQVSPENTASFSPQEEIQRLKELVEQKPDHYEYHLQLAELYDQQRQGAFAASEAEAVIALRPNNAAVEKAYRLAAIGYYYDGQFQKSRDTIGEALKLDPADQIALGFQEMLKTVEEQVSPVQAVQKISAAEGLKSTQEILLARKKEGFVSSDRSGQYSDIFFDFGRLRFKTPKGWRKEMNVKVPPFSTVFIFYSKFADRPVPQIGITKDIPDANIQSAIDFSRQIKKKMEEKKFIGLKVSEPVEKNINGQKASFMEITFQQNQSASAWYQFLINGVIISVQYTNTIDQYESDFLALKNLVESIKIEAKKKF